jgi:TolB-like protein
MLHHFVLITEKRKDEVMAGFVHRSGHLFNFLTAVLICSMGGLLFHSVGFSAPASSENPGELSTLEKQELVEQSVAQFEQGDRAKAQQGLENASRVFPENYAVPYYLGVIYLEQGRRAEAIAQWQRYVEMDPQSENAFKIRKMLTLLLREEARESARQAVAAEATITSGQADDQTIAVTTFKNLGSNQLGPLGKGMAAMLISDLSQVPDLQVVDRIRLQALLEEMALGTSGLVDKQTAPQVGRLLKAKHVTTGSLTDLESINMMIASVVMDTDQQTSIGSQQAQGGWLSFTIWKRRSLARLSRILAGIAGLFRLGSKRFIPEACRPWWPIPGDWTISTRKDTSRPGPCSKNPSRKIRSSSWPKTR